MTGVRIRSLAAAVGVAALLASACGTRFESPAAVVDGHRIAQEAVQRDDDIFLLFPSTAQQFAGQAGHKNLTRLVLFRLILLEVLRPYATGHGVSANAATVAQQVQQLTSDFGSAPALQARLRTLGLTLTDVRGNVADTTIITSVETTVVAQRLGSAAATASQQQKDQVFVAFLQQQLRAARIEVNPRFGKLDITMTTVSPIVSTQG